jgi:hypothetical protein
VSNVQRFLVNDFDNRDEFDHCEIDKQNRLDDVFLFVDVNVDECRKRSDDQIHKCDYKVNAHKIFLQFKETHVVIALFCYDVVCIYHELFRIVRHKKHQNVQLFEVHQIQKTFRNVKNRVENDVSSFVVHLAQKHHDVFISCYDCFFRIFDRSRRLIFEIRRERDSIANRVLRTRQIQNSKNEVKNDDVYCREYLRVNDDICLEKIDENDIIRFEHDLFF